MLIPFHVDTPWNNLQSITISHPLNTILHNMTGVKRQSTSLAAILVDRGTGGPGERGLIQKWFRLITRRAELEGLQRLSGSRHLPLTHLFSFMLPCLSTLVADNADLSAGEAIPNQSFDGHGPSWVAKRSSRSAMAKPLCSKPLFLLFRIQGSRTVTIKMRFTLGDVAW